LKIKSNTIAGKLGLASIYGIIVFLGLITLFPLLNILAISMSSSGAVTANAVGILPVNFTLEPYRMLVDDPQFWRSFGISVQRVVLSLLLNMLLIILMAYPLSKNKGEFKGRSIYMNLLIFAMLFNGGMIPTYLVVRNLGLLNTIWSLVLPGAVPVFSVILMMNFFRGIPKALEEAAVIDGATPLQILIRVYLPISIPSLATVALFSIVGSWNDFFSGLIYMTRTANYPLMTYIQSLTVDIQQLIQQGIDSSNLSSLMGINNRNLNAAKIVVSSIPLLLIYPLLQRYFITGIVVGSVKE
jgi:putative aldouronate transport system permease protein